MRYFSYTEERRGDAVIGVVYGSMLSDNIGVYGTSDEKVCSVDVDDTNLALWLSIQEVPMLEISIEMFTQVRAGSEQWHYEWAHQKRQRAKEMEEATAVVDTVGYDADETAMDRIDRVLTLANWKYNQAIASGLSPMDAYSAVYKTIVSWKGKDNAFHDTDIEGLATLQEAAMASMKVVWEKYG